MRKLLLIVTLVITLFAFLSADVYIKTKNHTDAVEMAGQKQPAKDEISEQWVAGDKFANVTPGQTMVVDLSKKAMYVIYHNTKSYVEAKLPLDISKLIPEQLAQMMGMMKMTVKVAATGETKKIGKWNCKGYDVDVDMTMMKIKTKSWVTTDVPFDWETYSEKMYSVFMKATMVMLDEKALNEFKKMKGFQVAAEVSMSLMGQSVTSTSNVLEISQKPAPPGIYSVPAGYTKKDKLKMPGF